MKTKRLVGAVAFAVCGLGWAACTGSAGPAGAQGDPGTNGTAGATGATGPAGPAGTATNTPAISAVSPLVALLARTATITVSGSETNWSSSAKVSFGTDITVTKTVVASPASIVVDVTIPATATVGSRDVTVTDGSASLKYSGAFNVAPPASLVVQGDQAQGSVLDVLVTDTDSEHLFDTTSTTDLFGNTTFTNFAAGTAPDTTMFQTLSVTPQAAEVVLLLDIDVAAGAQTVDLQSGPTASALDFPVPSGVTIAARTPVAFTAAAAGTGTFANPWSSGLLSYASANASLAVVDVVQTTTGTVPSTSNLQLFRLPKSGHFADQGDATSPTLFTTASTDPTYFITFDSSGAAGYGYSFAATTTAATGVAQATTVPDSMAGAQAITLTTPVIVTGATLTSASDARWFSFTAAAGDVGKSVRVLTERGPTGDANTDVAVDVEDSTGTSIAMGPIDNGYEENVLSGPIAATGTYYVVITAGSSYATTATKYQVMVRLE